MKRLLLITILTAISIITYAQEKTYAVIITTQINLQTKGEVKIELGDEIIKTPFNTATKAINSISTLGWQLEKTYVVTYEKMNRSVHYWVVSKENTTAEDLKKFKEKTQKKTEK